MVETSASVISFVLKSDQTETKCIKRYIEGATESFLFCMLTETQFVVLRLKCVTTF